MGGRLGTSRPLAVDGRWAGTAMLTTLLLAGTAACSIGSAPALRLAGGVSTGAEITQGDVAVGRPVTVGAIILCGSGPDARVDGVRLVGVRGDLALTSFAVRPNPAATGGQPVGVADEPLSAPLIGATPTGPAAALACADGEQGSELLIEVIRTGPEDGCARGGLDVSYTAAAGHGTLHVPLAVGLGAGPVVLACR